MIGRQFLDTSQGYPDHDLELYVPIFTLRWIISFRVVSVTLLFIGHPFGEEDDYFETNWLIDRNFQISGQAHGPTIIQQSCIVWYEAPECSIVSSSTTLVI
ncbi:hypothetical protein Q7C36_022088 [Tachysurus vachellii]|uniref:Bestrophin homolog n=1 Tax=Tachysurus vachellii TaxID=175792 RepID=A0AA88LQ43_TACVA|nr:hypothetical protein Q7C36_022088 [Tachysurus vachellii]